ncbi:GNAT family N-acetyltransferase [Legionella feeleii]|uniref:N-acetyltransferase ats1 n=1 Tax=Legionella feeleii TaxID=453 RepID=A0A0W0U0R3_9GAMM|nr:GNAT family N-acetyltransferase [Legionella feeleii]KTD01528.1 N-acetyltransferase ats1 [Legionella feeleii]SPX59341.1 N-acetyltransferase ats1 [Legionella feeleii]
MLAIIQAQPRYLGTIYSLIRELAKHEGILDKIQITEQQLGELLFGVNPYHFVAVALVNGNVVGIAMYNITYHNICFNAVPGIYLENLFVSPEFRGQGIGKALLTYVAGEAKAKNCSRVEWWVKRNNSAASHFYKSMGAIELADLAIYKCEKTCIDKLTENHE